MSREAFGQLAALSNGAGMMVAELDAMPIVRIEPDLNVTAKRLGEIVARLDMYSMNGDQVFFDHLGEMQVMTGRKFRTWISDYVITAVKFDKATGEPWPCSLAVDEAATVLESENFKRGVRGLKGVNQVRCPVIRAGGKLEYMPWGYDEETQIYTVPGGLDYDVEVPLEVAKGRFQRLFSTFPITDDRSMGVQIAAMLALYIRHLPGGTGLRPGFLWYANKPGTGKSVLAKACLYPVLGRAAVAKMKKNEDLDKEMEAFARASVPYIFLDNLRGSLDSTTIEQMMTSEEQTGRSMGGHGTFTAQNTMLLLGTANQIDLTEDALRRWLLVDLFEKGNVGDREGFETLDDRRMKTPAWRIEMLEAMCGLVAHWHAEGMPGGSVRLESFESYASLLGGIVEIAGYSAPFKKAVLPDAKSPGQAEFEDLLRLILVEMDGDAERDFTLPDLARLARAGQLYQKDVGTEAEGKKLTIKEDGIAPAERSMALDHGYMTPAHASAFGKRITKLVGTEPQVDNVRLEFGKRAQSRKATYTVKRM
jgi:hypothetical protein